MKTPKRDRKTCKKERKKERINAVRDETAFTRPAWCSLSVITTAESKTHTHYTLTVELKRRWQILHEMTCFFFRDWGTPNVWFITAFCTGSIWRKGEKMMLKWTEKKKKIFFFCKNHFLPINRLSLRSFKYILSIPAALSSGNPEPDARGRGTFPRHSSPWECTPHHNESASGRTSVCFRASRMFLLFIRSHPWPAGTLPGQCVCVCVCLMKSPIVTSEYCRGSGDKHDITAGMKEMRKEMREEKRMMSRAEDNSSGSIKKIKWEQITQKKKQENAWV